MGNRSSSHYPPPPHWMHQRTSYSTTTSPYPESKQRPIAPGAFAEPYMLHNPHHPQSKAQMRRSMISLNADSGYMGGPDSERLGQMRGSRMSLNQVDFEPAMMPPPRILIPHDAKTLKKLEKMEKKHQKLMKKLGARGIPIQMPVPPPLPMHPMYSRAMSFDDLHRMHEAPEIDVRMRQRDWRATEERRGLPTRRETQSQYVKHNYSSTNRRTELNGSLASSSPMTSSEEGGHSSDPWNTSSISSGKRDIISPPMYSSTPHHHNHQQIRQVTSPQPPVTKTIEVKVERSEKVEQQVSEPPKAPSTQTTSSTSSRIQHHHHVAPNSNATYAQPIIRGQPSYGSRSSSIATSQMRCDQSEIDFSWVNEEEDKLKRESKRIDSLPEFYFGMDPPPVGSNDEKENEEEKRRRRKSSVLEKTAAFEIEARRNDRKEPTFLSRSSHQLLTTSEIPPADYSPLSIHTKEMGGPAERRIYRIQKQQQQHQSSDDRRYRSSIAF
ncbi:hypothetical protein GCK72_013606 [Caenorhabditis remanei]|uniref:Uncharacterized protein n=1 Tax=Caenorhabditis remanei TaxID=31234 RepID=A0A6A5GR52_CAERE|nr:hypothetical protein GCK72_013606 [Caenorhabditis remanei]KAF1757151.1 hypothetical protein GCK72_013606 [Caenorhabditis remanei]